MTTVKVKFRPSTVEDRPGTIVYLVTHRRIARQITTSYKVFPCEWDEERSEPVLVSDSSRTNIINRITQKLRSDMERLEAIIKRFTTGAAAIRRMTWWQSSGTPKGRIPFSISWKMSSNGYGS